MTRIIQRIRSKQRILFSTLMLAQLPFSSVQKIYIYGLLKNILNIILSFLDLTDQLVLLNS